MLLIGRNDGVLEVLKVIVDSAVDSIKVISQACYSLPRLNESFEYAFIFPGNSPTVGTACKDTTLEAGQALFCPRMDERILGMASRDITLTYSREIFIGIGVGVSNRGRIQFLLFDIFVNASTFLKSSFPSHPLQTPIPWEVWGPQNTRWFQRDSGLGLHGQRVVDAVLCEHESGGEEDESGGEEHENGGEEHESGSQEHESGGQEHESDGEEYESDGSGEEYEIRKWRLRVRDFNPIAVRRSAQGQIEKGWKCRAVTSPSTTFTEGTCEKGIISSLPYTEVISEETFCTDDALMDGSRLFLSPKVSER
jgi:hypothetical protein